MNLINRVAIALLLLIINLPTTVWADHHDAEQPMILLADRINFFNRSHRVNLNGNILIRQGSSRVMANHGIAQGDSHNKLIKATAYGEPAQFETQLENGRKLNAYASKIIYEPQQHWIILKGNAVVSVDDQHFHADNLTYDLVHQRVISNKHVDVTPVITLPDKTT